MKIIIIGAGQVGSTLAENLAREYHDITLIDLDETRLQFIQDHHDIRTVTGTGCHPDILLADEPFAAIDAMTREAMQAEMERIVMETGQTCVFITHSIDEAILLGDRVVVISYRPGKVKEIVDINFPRPRMSNSEVKTSREYAQIRDHIWKLVKDEASQTNRGE